MSESVRPRSHSSNPYAAPTVEGGGSPVLAGVGQAPELYNPDAASNWSLLFTPIFGAYLHWQNWKALGQNKGLGWFIGNLIAVPLATVLSAGGARIGFLVLLRRTPSTAC